MKELGLDIQFRFRETKDLINRYKANNRYKLVVNHFKNKPRSVLRRFIADSVIKPATPTSTSRFIAPESFIPSMKTVEGLVLLLKGKIKARANTINKPTRMEARQINAAKTWLATQLSLSNGSYHKDYDELRMKEDNITITIIKRFLATLNPDQLRFIKIKHDLIGVTYDSREYMKKLESIFDS